MTALTVQKIISAIELIAETTPDRVGIRRMVTGTFVRKHLRTMNDKALVELECLSIYALGDILNQGSIWSDEVDQIVKGAQKAYHFI
jgi:hypothetical protein